MAYVRLVNKDNEMVQENNNFRLELTGSLSLPRVIEHEGITYRFDRREGPVTIYVQSDI